MKRTMVMIVAAVFIAVLFSGNGLLITHAASTNSFSSRTGDNSGNNWNPGSQGGHNSQGNSGNSGTGDHSQGNSGNSGTGDHSQGNSGNSGTGNGNGGHSSSSGNGQQSYQSLSLSIQGGVVSAGSQHYVIEQSGQVMMASFMSSVIDTTQPTHFNYYLSATVQGMTTTGYAGFHLTGTLDGVGTVDISGVGPIVGTVAAVCLPNYDSPNADGSCPSGDTSQVPAYFVGMENIQVTIGTSHQTMQAVPMLFESAYLNPFGAPLVLGTADGFATLQIVSTYNYATVEWSNVVDQALVGGTLGNQAVEGTLTQVASEYENLVTGTAVDHGTITFSGMSMSSLNLSGQYSGSSTTPTSQTQDCSASLGFPDGSQMCTDYAFQSAGSFSMNSSGQSFNISGSYETNWPIPAFSFGGTITATVS